MAFKILFSLILIVYVVITIANSSNRNFATSQIRQRNLTSTSTRKEYYELVQRKRRYKRERLQERTISLTLLRLLLLSGDIESNPGPYPCPRCHQNFDRGSRLDEHLAKQQLLTCGHCRKNFCSEAQVRQHIRCLLYTSPSPRDS